MEEEYTDFPPTRWSLVVKAIQGDEAAAREALDSLLRLYLPALRAHLVFRRGVQAEDADELVAGFVSDRIVERDLIHHANQQKGRFRAFLAVSLDNYVSSRGRFDRRMKRWAGTPVSLDEATDVATGDGETDAFDVAWARQTLQEALRRMRQDCEFRGRMEMWEVFKGRVVDPLLYDKEAVPLEELIRRLGFSSPMRVSNALATAKRTFIRVLRCVIAEYADESDIEEELNDLKRILARSRAMQGRGWRNRY